MKKPRYIAIQSYLRHGDEVGMFQKLSWPLVYGRAPAFHRGCSVGYLDGLYDVFSAVCRDRDRAAELVEWINSPVFEAEKFKPNFQADENLDWEAAYRKIRRERPQFAVGLDLDAGTMEIWAEPYLKPCRLTADMPAGLTQAVFRTAGAIGCGLGTDEAMRLREFREPWEEIARCLEEPDPEAALASAAGKDTLARGYWVDSETQMARNLLHPGTAELGQTPCCVLHIPNGLGPGRDGGLCFGIDGTACRLVLPFVGDGMDMEMKGVRPGRAGVLDFLDQALAADCPLRALVRIYAAQDHLKHARRAKYAQRHLRFLPCIGALRRYAADSIVYLRGVTTWLLDLPCIRLGKREALNALNVETRDLPGLGGGAGGSFATPEMPLLLRTEDSWRAATFQDLRGLVERALAEEPPSRRIDFFYELSDAVQDVILVGERGFALLPWSTRLVPVNLSRGIGSKLVLVSSVGVWTAEELEELGGSLYGMLELAREAVRDDGVRECYDLDTLVQVFPFHGPKARQAAQLIQERKAWVLNEQLWLETLPMGWVYTLAVFQSGDVGVACGYPEDEETWKDTCARLYKRALKQPPELAAILIHMPAEPA